MLYQKMKSDQEYLLPNLCLAMFRYVGNIDYDLEIHTIDINKSGLFCCCSLEISHIYILGFHSHATLSYTAFLPH